MFYIIATPIGHPDDITLRALQILQSVDYVICEDTRVTNRLLHHHAIKASLLIYHDHSTEKDRDKILQKLRASHTMALVSDAGTPLISDPGFKLLRAIKEENLPMTALPGPSAVINALVLSGFPPYPFSFYGFITMEQLRNSLFLETLRCTEATSVFFITPHDLQDILTSLHQHFPTREIALIREMTKYYEEIKKDTANILKDHYKKQPPKGEMVLVIKPTSSEEKYVGDILLKTLISEMSQHMSWKEAIEEIACKFSLPKRFVYQQALLLKEEK